MKAESIKGIINDAIPKLACSTPSLWDLKSVTQEKLTSVLKLRYGSIYQMISDKQTV